MHNGNNCTAHSTTITYLFPLRQDQISEHRDSVLHLKQMTLNEKLAHKYWRRDVCMHIYKGEGSVGSKGNSTVHVLKTTSFPIQNSKFIESPTRNMYSNSNKSICSVCMKSRHVQFEEFPKLLQFLY